MSWFILYVAIVFEVMGTVCMKLSAGFTRLIPSISMFIFYGIGFFFLTIALKDIDVSLTYAIWSGIGTAMISVIGVVWFKEKSSVIKYVSILLIILGVIGLNISSTPPISTP